MFRNKFLSNVSWIMIGRIFQLSLTFITTMLVTRYLGPDQYGKITVAYSYVSLFIPFCALGMNDIAIKSFVDNKDKNDETLGTMLCLRLASSILSMGIIYLLFKIGNDDSLLMTVGMLQALSLVFQVFESIAYWHQSRMLSKNVGVIYAVSYSLTAIFRIVGLLIKGDIRWFAFAVSLDYIVIAVLLIFAYFKNGHKLSFSFEIAKKLLSKSYHYIFASIMVVIYSKADTIILGNLVDEASVGYYAAATTLCNAWPFVLTAIIDSASPIIIDLFKKDKEAYKQRLRQLYAAIFYIGVIVALVFTFGSNLIIGIIYGESYYPAVMPLRIVCWSTIFAYLGVSRTIWMQCENKLQYEKTLSLFGAIIDIALNYVLISRFGINGAAIALLVTQIMTNLILPLMIKETRENGKLILDAIIFKGIFNREE